MPDSLINSLSQLPNLSVKSRSSVFRYKGRDIDPQKVASEWSVQAVLEGRVVQHGDDLMISLSLVDGSNGNQIWGRQYDRKLSQEKGRWVPPSHIAMVYNALGNTDEAIACQKGIDQHDPKIAFLKVEPKWNNLRNDPRFQDVMWRAGF